MLKIGLFIWQMDGMFTYHNLPRYADNDRIDGVDLTTTALAPTRLFAPMVIAPNTLAPAPITTWSSMVGWRFVLCRLVPPSVTP